MNGVHSLSGIQWVRRRSATAVRRGYAAPAGLRCPRSAHESVEVYLTTPDVVSLDALAGSAQFPSCSPSSWNQF